MRVQRDVMHTELLMSWLQGSYHIPALVQLRLAKWPVANQLRRVS